MLERIDRELLDRIMTARKAEGVANSTVNRTLEVVRAVLRRAAFDWDWIAKAPRVRMLPEPKRRIRWLTREEADRLIGTLPGHLAAMARFSLETGLRRSNVTGLLWSQVDLTRRTAWVHADQAKARKAIAVPLSATAVIVIRKQIGKHSTHVFSYRGKPVRQVNTKTWRQALKRVGIEDFRWHDLRHTWASWHVQAGTPLPALQELGVTDRRNRAGDDRRNGARVRRESGHLWRGQECVVFDVFATFDLPAAGGSFGVRYDWPSSTRQYALWRKRSRVAEASRRFAGNA
jgi:integrase